jgi:hypothetical protein
VGEVFLNRNGERRKCFSSETNARKMLFRVVLDKLYTIGITIFFSVVKINEILRRNAIFRLCRNVVNQ